MGTRTIFEWDRLATARGLLGTIFAGLGGWQSPLSSTVWYRLVPSGTV